MRIPVESPQSPTSGFPPFAFCFFAVVPAHHSAPFELSMSKFGFHLRRCVLQHYFSGLHDKRLVRGGPTAAGSSCLRLLVRYKSRQEVDLHVPSRCTGKKKHVTIAHARVRYQIYSYRSVLCARSKFLPLAAYFRAAQRLHEIKLAASWFSACTPAKITKA